MRDPQDDYTHDLIDHRDCPCGFSGPTDIHLYGNPALLSVDLQWWCPVCGCEHVTSRPVQRRRRRVA